MNTEDKTNWLDQTGLVMYRSKTSPNLILKRLDERVDRWLWVDEQRGNTVIRICRKKEITFSDWTPITKEEYDEKYRDNIFALKKGVRFLYSPKKVEEMYKEHEDENTKIMDKSVDSYKDMINKHPELDSFNMSYFEERWIVKKDTIYAATEAVRNGLEYAKECLDLHKASIRKETKKNALWTKTMEKDIEQMEMALEMLRKEPVK